MKPLYLRFQSVLRIRDVYPGSEFFPSRIEGQKDSGYASKNLSILTQKIVSKLQKYDPDCSSRIRIPDPDPGSCFLPILDPGSRGQKGTGSATLHIIHTYKGLDKNT
jgi:hypothetical protein